MGILALLPALALPAFAQAAAGCVRLLLDATSKNGALLLNISPKADGTIPDDQPCDYAWAFKITGLKLK